MSNESVLNEKCMNMERKIHDLTHALVRMEEEKAKYELEFRETLKQEKEKIMQVIVHIIREQRFCLKKVLSCISYTYFILI